MNPFLFSHRISSAVVGFVALSLLVRGSAADDSQTSPLTLADALGRVEAGHPWLRGLDVEARLADARVAMAEVRPVGEVSLDLENLFGTGEMRGAHGLETTLQFSRALDSTSRRSARGDVARGLNEAERLAWEERRRALLAEAARRFIAVAAAQADHAAAQQAVDLATQTETAAQDRFTKAAGSATDVARARHTRVEAGIGAQRAERVLVTARQSLAALWGADVPDFFTAAADLDDLTPVASYEALAPRLADTPTQARFAALVRWRIAQENLARTTTSRGQPRWSAGLRRVEASDDWGFVGGLTYALPERALGNAQAAETRAERDRLEIEREVAQLDARQVLFALYQELVQARIEHTAAREELIPAAEAWLAGAEEGLRAGRFALRDVLDAQRALLDARRHQLAVAAAYHLTLVEIESLLGATASNNP
jgi:cobalt-zinc-cadmium efflux system outer membrane protein